MLESPDVALVVVSMLNIEDDYAFDGRIPFVEG
jgi:hypothetical protein